jgi:hypothetical protein
MSARQSPAFDIVSGATLSGAVFELFVERERLERYVRQLGPLAIEEGGAESREQASISCEIWTVTNGRSLLGGIDAAQISERWASFAGGLVGAIWGIQLGWLRARGSSHRRDLRASASETARLGAGYASGLVEKATRSISLGPYRELLIGVPNVVLTGSAQRHTLVIGMVTDDRLALWFDRWGGYGYRKRLGEFELTHSESFRVSSDGALLLSGRVEPAGFASGTLDWVEERWAQPLLGALDGSFRRSRLERRLDAERARALAGTLDLGIELAAPLAGPHRFDASGRTGRAVAFSDVTTRISRSERA